MMTSSSWTKEENIQHQQDPTPPKRIFQLTESQTAYKIEWQWSEDIKAVHLNMHYGIISALKTDDSKHSDQIPASKLRNLDMSNVKIDGSSLIIGFTVMQDTNKAIDPSSILIVTPDEVEENEQSSTEDRTTPQATRKSRKRRDKAV